MSFFSRHAVASFTGINEARLAADASRAAADSSAAESGPLALPHRRNVVTVHCRRDAASGTFGPATAAARGLQGTADVVHRLVDMRGLDQRRAAEVVSRIERTLSAFAAAASADVADGEGDAARAFIQSTAAKAVGDASDEAASAAGGANSGTFAHSVTSLIGTTAEAKRGGGGATAKTAGASGAAAAQATSTPASRFPHALTSTFPAVVEVPQLYVCACIDIGDANDNGSAVNNGSVDSRPTPLLGGKEDSETPRSAGATTGPSLSPLPSESQYPGFASVVDPVLLQGAHGGPSAPLGGPGAGGLGVQPTPRCDQVVRLTTPYRPAGNASDFVRELVDVGDAPFRGIASAAAAAAQAGANPAASPTAAGLQSSAASPSRASRGSAMSAGAQARMQPVNMGPGSARAARVEQFVALVCAKVLASLAQLHDDGLTHGNVCAANVFVTKHVLTPTLGGDTAAFARSFPAHARTPAILSDEAGGGMLPAAADIWPLEVALHDAGTHRFPATDEAAELCPDLTPFALRAAPHGRVARALMERDECAAVESDVGREIAASQQRAAAESSVDLLPAVGLIFTPDGPEEDDHASAQTGAPGDGGEAMSSSAVPSPMQRPADPSLQHQQLTSPASTLAAGAKESVVSILGLPPPPVEAQFVAPQSLAALQYLGDARQDLWAVGQLAVELLNGAPEPPFSGPSGVALLRRESTPWSQHARAFVSACCGRNDAVTAVELLRQPFIRRNVAAFARALAAGGVSETHLRELRGFASSSPDALAPSARDRAGSTASPLTSALNPRLAPFTTSAPASPGLGDLLGGGSASGSVVFSAAARAVLAATEGLDGPPAGSGGGSASQHHHHHHAAAAQKPARTQLGDAIKGATAGPNFDHRTVLKRLATEAASAAALAQQQLSNATPAAAAVAVTASGNSAAPSVFGSAAAVASATPGGFGALGSPPRGHAMQLPALDADAASAVGGQMPQIGASTRSSPSTARRARIADSAPDVVPSPLPVSGDRLSPAGGDSNPLGPARVAADANRAPSAVTTVLGPALEAVRDGSDSIAQGLAAPRSLDGGSRVRYGDPAASPAAQQALEELARTLAWAEDSIPGFGQQLVVSMAHSAAHFGNAAREARDHKRALAGFAGVDADDSTVANSSDDDDNPASRARAASARRIAALTAPPGLAEVAAKLEPTTAATARRLGGLASGLMPHATAITTTRLNAAGEAVEDLDVDGDGDGDGGERAFGGGGFVQRATSGRHAGTDQTPRSGKSAQLLQPPPPETYNAVDLSNFVFAKWFAQSHSADTSSLLAFAEAHAGVASAGMAAASALSGAALAASSSSGLFGDPAVPANGAGSTAAGGPGAHGSPSRSFMAHSGGTVHSRRGSFHQQHQQQHRRAGSMDARAPSR